MTETPIPATAVAAAGAAVRAYLRMAAGAEAVAVERAVGAAFSLAEAFCGGLLVSRASGDGLPASWADMPAPVSHAIVLVSAHLLEHRDGWPAGATALLRPFRALRLEPTP